MVDVQSGTLIGEAGVELSGNLKKRMANRSETGFFRENEKKTKDFQNRAFRTVQAALFARFPVVTHITGVDQEVN
jgi:hypothetical protein